MCVVGCGERENASSGNPYKVLANKNGRVAISMAIDKDTLCKTIINNGTKGIDYLVSQNLAFDENEKDYREIVGDRGV